MKIYRLLLFPILSVFILSCGSSKPQIDDRPDWVKSRPISEINFIGIGMASKKMSPFDYMSIAKNNALSDLSSEISINLSSSSVLSSLETVNNFTEDYRSTIKAKTKKELEDYKLISTYENDEVYWVYYMLNKNDYRNKLERKKQFAIGKAKDYYVKSLNAYNSHDSKLAMIMNIRAIEAVKDYWGENLVVSINGSNLYLGNELILNLNRIINELELVPNYYSIKVIRGKSLPDSLSTYKVLNKKGIAQHGIPVSFSISENRLSNNIRVSNKAGYVSIYLDKISSKSNRSSITSKIIIDDIIKEASSDFLLVKLLNKISTPESEIAINVKNPNVYIKSSEAILGEKTDKNILGSSLKLYFENKGFTIVDDIDSSHFVIKIVSDTDRLALNRKGIYSSSFDSSIIMYSNGNEIFSTSISKISGRGSSFALASINAYNKADKEIIIRIANQLYREISE